MIHRTSPSLGIVPMPAEACDSWCLWNSKTQVNKSFFKEFKKLSWKTNVRGKIHIKFDMDQNLCPGVFGRQNYVLCNAKNGLSVFVELPNSPVPGDRCMYTTIVYEQLLTSARDGQVRKSRKQARRVSTRQGNFARIRVFFSPVLYSF